MSVSAMIYVWKHSKAESGELLALMALADFADDSGEASPTIGELSDRARLSRRQVQRALRELEEANEISRRGKTKDGTVRYRIRGVKGAVMVTPAEPSSVPDSAEVAAYFQSRSVKHPVLEADAFVEYWTDRNWTDPKTGAPVKSWKGRAATWAKNSLNSPARSKASSTYVRGLFTYQEALRYAQERGTGDLSKFFERVEDEHGGKPKWRAK